MPGEGSRGGKIIGHTAAGKPIYAGGGAGATSGAYQRQLLQAEKEKRAKAGAKPESKTFSPQAKLATSTAYIPRRPQYATIKSEGADMDKFDKLMKSMGVTIGERGLVNSASNQGFTVADFNTSGSRVGMVKSARERLYEQMGNVRERDIRKAFGDENVKDQHAESWHMDGNSLVHKFSTTAEQISDLHDQDSQREAASVVVQRPAEKKLGVGPQAEKSMAQKLLTEDELFMKAMEDDEEDGEFDSEEDDEGAEEKEQEAEAKKQAARDKSKKSEDAPDLLKASKPLGHTASGKPIMDEAEHKAHADFEHSDHEDAFRAHTQAMGEHQRYMYDLMGGEQSDEKRKLQSKLKDRIAHCDEQRVKHLKKIYKSVTGKLVNDLSKGCTPEESDLSGAKLKREAKKMAKLHENAPAVAEKSLIDELVDLVKSDNFAKKVPAQRAPAPARKSMKGFVKAAGAGGVIMDFGHRTGNPHADRFTALLQQNSDRIQSEIAVDQANSYEKALKEYVTSGDKAYMAKHNGPGPGVDLDTPMDKQVANEFAKGQLQVSQARKSFGEQTIAVGGETVQATSETDAALIEMMKNSGVDFSE